MSRPFDRGKTYEPEARVNERIRIAQVRLVDEDGKQMGVVKTEEAKRVARERGLDLVEVASNARPPVCRIMDYGKYKYENRKKQKKPHANQLKEIRLRPKTGEHDLDFKVNRAREFLEKGHKVQLTMLFRGREREFTGRAREKMQNVARDVEDLAKVEQMPRMEGRRMLMVLAPMKKGERKAGGGPESDGAAAGDGAS